jgi:hypothetical protein
MNIRGEFLESIHIIGIPILSGSAAGYFFAETWGMVLLIPSWRPNLATWSATFHGLENAFASS